jgi:AcrR family transcriptional regulator
MEKQATRNPEQTRAAILEAAFMEMYEHGFQAASLERILANTNLTKGALYHHFASKHALGIAVIREVVSGFVFERNASPLKKTHEPIPAMLEIIDGHLAETEPRLLELGCPLNNLIQEMSPLDEEFRTNLQDIHFTWQRTIAEALERGQANGNVRADVDCEEVSMFIIAAVEGCIGTAKNLQSMEAFRGCLNQLRFFIASLAA